MAGRGPAPKDPSTRARRNRDPIPMRVITAPPVSQPDLPDFVWHPATLAWWSMWAESPLSSEFTASDWSFLMDTALAHTAVWCGALDRLAELRQRVAKFGATPEDRARLRITFAQADDADDKRGTRAKAPAKSRYAGLKLA